ncbi:MAG: hypothetical protein JW873_06965 [Candidatus Saganbacteria bacterium]|nr:hypothetical protein [Candidatus Saganbacteria bacterium]
MGMKTIWHPGFYRPSYRSMCFAASEASGGGAAVAPKLTLQEIKAAFTTASKAGCDIAERDPEMRAEFLRVSRTFGSLPIEGKAALIAEYAEERLTTVQQMIVDAAESKPADDPRAPKYWVAKNVWEGILNHRTAKKEDRRPDSDIIGELFPLLEPKKQEIARELGNTYAFWAHFCACSEYGVIGTTGAQYSILLNLSDPDKAVIDAVSGMRDLGSNLRGYANYLYMTND